MCLTKYMSETEIKFPDYLVSIVTPTHLRHKFMKQLVKNVCKQDYPLKNIEWIIIDDGIIPVGETVMNEMGDISVLRDLVYIYMKPDPKLTIGHKRNIGKTVARGEFIVHMDDDDWYAPNYVSVLVERLSKSSKYHIVGATTMYFIFLDTPFIQKSGPFHVNHCCAGLMAYRKAYANLVNYDFKATHGEERLFLRSFQQPVLQIENSYKIFVGINHHSNTWDKNKMKRENTNMLWWDIIKDPEEQSFYYCVYKHHYFPYHKNRYNCLELCKALKLLIGFM